VRRTGRVERGFGLAIMPPFPANFALWSQIDCKLQSSSRKESYVTNAHKTNT
jgi:hypothetical protein